MLRRHPRSTLLPNTTLFRSRRLREPVEKEHELAVLGTVGPGPEAQVADGELDELLHVSPARAGRATPRGRDRKSTRLNSSHANISYAVFCLLKNRYIYFSDY